MLDLRIFGVWDLESGIWSLELGLFKLEDDIPSRASLTLIQLRTSGDFSRLYHIWLAQ